MANASKKVLLVDDELLIIRVLKRFLDREGCTVLHAQTSEDALATFEAEQPFDVLLCDVHLGSKENGWKVAEKIYLAQPSIRVVMLSGAISFGATPDTLEYTMLQKPFNQEDLMRAMNGS